MARLPRSPAKISSTGELVGWIHDPPMLAGRQTAVSSWMLKPKELTSAVVSFREINVIDRGIAVSRVDVGAHTPLVSSIGETSG